MIKYGIKNIEKDIINDGKYADDLKKLKKDKFKNKSLKSLKFILPYIIETAIMWRLIKLIPLNKDDDFLVKFVCASCSFVGASSIYGITALIKEVMELGYSYKKYSKDIDKINKNYIEKVFELSRGIK